ncbi:hypothetical protein [Pseudomonas canadensis]|uniref:hypothetical protein n=1 Tax=Pseudomonas canadensis TaxID=915099 RepID=UPI002735C408|nr:hypothetical protein [Pseudomonas canadensis]WLH31159.1 hypothetical protein PSH56_05470 [Pseudomonas canadensis]
MSTWTASRLMQLTGAALVSGLLLGLPGTTTAATVNMSRTCCNPLSPAPMKAMSQ